MPRPRSRDLIRALPAVSQELLRLAALWTLGTACAASATSAAIPTAQVDPYTAGAADELRAAGYVSLGPFEIGARRTSAQLDAAATGSKICWIETAHFRLGVQLPSYHVPAQDRESVREELRVLRKSLPSVPLDARELDPWLRAHLFAQRCEQTYDRLQQQLGVTDRDFPQSNRVRMDDTFMGLGPYLGQGDKFLVLVFDCAATFDWYCREVYRRPNVQWPLRYNHGWRRSLGFVTSTRFQGNLGEDRALHGHVVYNVIYNLLDGFRHLCHETPVWFKTGLAQWHLRRISPDWPNFDRPPGRAPRGSSGSADWPARVRALIRGKAARDTEDLASFRDFTAFQASDYQLAWSRVSYLIDRHERDLGWFWRQMKTPIGGGRGTPDWQLVLDQQSRSFQEAFGYDDWAAFDAAWQAWAVAER